MILTDAEKKRRLERAMSGELNIPENLNRATASLFIENYKRTGCDKKGLTPPYTWSMKDRDGALSFPQLYMQCASDYEAALVLLGRWGHWEKLLKTKWFPPKLEKWQKEREERMKALALSKLYDKAAKGNTSALNTVVRETKANVKQKNLEPEQTESTKQDVSNSMNDWLDSSLAKLEK